MSTKTKIIIAIVVIATSIAVGRYSAPTKIVTKTVTIEVEKKVDKVADDTNRHKETTKVEVVKPDGSKETTTKIVEDTNKQHSSIDTDQLSKKSDSSKEIIKNNDKLTLSALAGVKLSDISSGLDFGASVTKPILGPITVGLFGLKSGMIGVSVGLTF
jgi:hypothetical protein